MLFSTLHDTRLWILAKYNSRYDFQNAVIFPDALIHQFQPLFMLCISLPRLVVNLWYAGHHMLFIFWIHITQILCSFKGGLCATEWRHFFSTRASLHSEYMCENDLCHCCWIYVVIAVMFLSVLNLPVFRVMGCRKRHWPMVAIDQYEIW